MSNVRVFPSEDKAKCERGDFFKRPSLQGREKSQAIKVWWLNEVVLVSRAAATGCALPVPSAH